MILKVVDILGTFNCVNTNAYSFSIYVWILTQIRIANDELHFLPLKCYFYSFALLAFSERLFAWWPSAALTRVNKDIRLVSWSKLWSSNWSKMSCRTKIGIIYVSSMIFLWISTRFMRTVIFTTFFL